MKDFFENINKKLIFSPQKRRNWKQASFILIEFTTLIRKKYKKYQKKWEIIFVEFRASSNPTGNMKVTLNKKVLNRK